MCVERFDRRRSSTGAWLWCTPSALRRPDLRFTVETAVDLDYMRRVYQEACASVTPAPLHALIAAADRIRAREAERPEVDAR